MSVPIWFAERVVQISVAVDVTVWIAVAVLAFVQLFALAAHAPYERYRARRRDEIFGTLLLDVRPVAVGLWSKVCLGFHMLMALVGAIGAIVCFALAAALMKAPQAAIYILCLGLIWSIYPVACLTYRPAPYCQIRDKGVCGRYTGFIAWNEIRAYEWEKMHLVILRLRAATAIHSFNVPDYQQKEVDRLLRERLHRTTARRRQASPSNNFQ